MTSLFHPYTYPSLSEHLLISLLDGWNSALPGMDPRSQHCLSTLFPSSDPCEPCPARLPLAVPAVCPLSYYPQVFLHYHRLVSVPCLPSDQMYHLTWTKGTLQMCWGALRWEDYSRLSTLAPTNLYVRQPGQRSCLGQGQVWYVTMKAEKGGSVTTEREGREGRIVREEEGGEDGESCEVCSCQP